MSIQHLGSACTIANTEPDGPSTEALTYEQLKERLRYPVNPAYLPLKTKKGKLASE